MTHEVLLLLGSNVDREYHLPLACRRLSERFLVLRSSDRYQSAAVGAPGTPDFQNQAVLIATDLDHTSLRLALREVESSQGRVRTADPNAPRTIDIDIVYVADGPDGAAHDVDSDLARYHHVAVPAAEIDGARRLADARTVDDIARSLGPPPHGFRRLHE
ncbi:MAG: 2-amino-4-hydroxy-6-hydroxymethyldihydropteridine diphosphokinase [Planctomycetes bacterium]|nr:2-amino-4-hydroxy-6-hydroxymethyldihydropteridine diphosphokinase [Planctomycetota bacterium]